MANSTQSSYKKNPSGVAIVNENNIRNSLTLKKSVFFNTVNKEDGKVHVQIPRYISAATNKQIPFKDSVYIAQSFKNQGILSGRVITEKGAKALGTEIKANAPHVEVKGNRQLTESGIEKKAAEEDKLLKKIEIETDEEKKENLKKELETTVKERTTGWEDFVTTYYPAYEVKDIKKLANVFMIKNTGYYNQQKFDAFAKENLKENQYRKGPAIDGDTAKNWKEHVKNCLSGREVILSKEKAQEFSSSMLNDLQNAHDNKEFFVFQNVVNQASKELYQEAAAEKERALSQSIEQNTPDKENSIEKEEQSNDIEVF